MKAITSQKGTRKKNKGGRPRKHASGTSGSTSITWKRISQPASTHHYEISSQGAVRRLLKSGQYYDLKPWVTGGPYAAVYLTGVKGATRNRKKVYVHRLVATHFIKDKKPGEVVHHLVGPHSNTKSTLDWVPVSENNKARKYFNQDGTRKMRRKPKNKVNVPSEKSPPKNANKPIESGKLPAPKKHLHSFKNILKDLLKTNKKFAKYWRYYLKKAKGVNESNFLAKYKEATGKGLGPNLTAIKIESALHELLRRGFEA